MKSNDWHSLDSVTQATILHCLEQFGIQPNEDNARQLLVFLNAVELYDERSRSYGQVWRNYGALSNLLSVARKADRLMKVWWHDRHDEDAAPHDFHKDELDDAWDLLNYAAFFIRNAKNLNLTGDRVTERCSRCGYVAKRCRCPKPPPSDSSPQDS